MLSTHPYLRAYMAGIVVPTVFVLVAFTGFCVVRFGYQVDVPIERAIVFPLALVPNLWGFWNMLYLALHRRRRLPLGLHGAVLPALLLPLAVVVTHALAFIDIPGGFMTIFWLALPALLVIYYLTWKYFVGFLNEFMGIAG